MRNNNCLPKKNHFPAIYKLIAIAIMLTLFVNSLSLYGNLPAKRLDGIRKLAMRFGEKIRVPANDATLKLYSLVG